MRGHITGRRALANRPTTPTTAPTPASTPEPTATPTLTAVQLRNERATAVLITLPGYDPVQHAARLPLVPARLRRAAGKERRPLTRQEGRSLLLISRYRVPVRTLSVPVSRISVPKFQKYLSQYLQHNMRDNVHYVANDVLNELMKKELARGRQNWPAMAKAQNIRNIILAWTESSKT